MAAKVRIELNRKGISELLKSDDVRYDMQQRGAKVLAQVNDPELADNNRDGYELSTFVGHDRAAAVVRTVTRKAKEDQAINHSLERAIGSAG